MRRLLTICCFLVGASLAAQQADHREELRARMSDYAQVMVDWQIDSILTFVEPKLFEVITREGLRQVFESSFADTNMTMRFTELTVDSISPLFVHDTTAYALVDYTAGMSVQMHSPSYQDSSFMNMMVAMMGSEEHRIEEGTHTLYLRSPKQLFALRHAPSEPWYIVEFNTDNPHLLNLLIPQPVQQHFTP